MSGKTTFFNLLTGSQLQTGIYHSGKTDVSTGHARIPDERVDFLALMFNPKKTTYAQLEVIDVPALKRGGNEFLSCVRDCDALVHIVRGFVNEDVLHEEGSLDIMRDISAINTELLLADLQLIETRLSRIKGSQKKKLENPLEEAALERCQEQLMEEKPLNLSALTERERESLTHIAFVTSKPLLIVVNLDEDQFSQKQWPLKQQVEEYCREQGYTLLEVCARMEEEISLLPEEDRGMFMEELGVEESGVGRLARALYSQLGLASFLTTGEDEVKAWTIRKGLPAKQAAGKVHSDIERGFIRAETVAFEHLKEAGSMAAARKLGHFRLEGKEYPVQDGDIINFRFNV